MTMAFRYEFDHKYRGQALIIGNEFKGKVGLERKGCANDLKMMEELFKRLDFKVTICKDLGAVDMEKELLKAACSASNEESDCFVLVLSTHGEEIREDKGTELPPAAEVWKHVVLAEDEKHVYVENIVNMFTDVEAPGLAGKPKLFFLQACRSRGSKNKLILISHPKFDQGHRIGVKKGVKRLLVEKFRCPGLNLFKKKRSEKHPIYDVDVTKDVDDLYKDWTDIKPKVTVVEPNDEKSSEGDEDDTADTSCRDGSSNEKNAVYTSGDDLIGPAHEADSAKGRDRNNEESDSEGYLTDEYSEGDDDTTDDSGDDTSEDGDVSREVSEDALREGTVEEDAGARLPQSPNTPMPAKPFDVVSINCPKDFLIMYPVMPGKSAFRSPSGSYLLQYLHKGENLARLVKGANLLQYLTRVSQDMAVYDYLPDLIMKSKSQDYKMEKLRGLMESNIGHLIENKQLLAKLLPKDHMLDIQQDASVVKSKLESIIPQLTKKQMRRILRRILPFKTTACIVHRLRDNVRLYPKSSNSSMAKAVTKASSP